MTLSIIVGILAVCVLVVVVLVVQIRIFFSKLSKDIGKDNLIKLLQNISDKQKDNSEKLEKLSGLIGDTRLGDRLHVQKVGFTKYNPFEEVGGEHSFSLCLLNDYNSGLILTGLHTRDRTRVYLKEVRKGVSAVELSKEESRVLKSAVGK